MTICYERFPRVLLGTVVPSALTGRRWPALEPQTPGSVRMASAVCARANERI